MIFELDNKFAKKTLTNAAQQFVIVYVNRILQKKKFFFFLSSHFIYFALLLVIFSCNFNVNFSYFFF